MNGGQPNGSVPNAATILTEAAAWCAKVWVAQKSIALALYQKTITLSLRGKC